MQLPRKSYLQISIYTGYFIVLLAFNLIGQLSFLFGQNTTGFFGQNNRFYLKDAVWYVKSYEKTDVYYYHNKDEADAVLRMSIKAQQELSSFFDYSPYSRIQIRIYKDAQDFREVPLVSHTELIPHPLEPDHVYAENEHGIYSPYYKGVPIFTINVWHPGTCAGLYTQLKTELAKLYLKDMLFGTERGTRAARSSFWMPSWFFNGLPAFLSENITPEDVGLLRSLTPEQALSLLFADKMSPAKKAVEKSFWAFMVKLHSYKKISEIVYMTRLRRGTDYGFYSVLGLSSETLQLQWKENFEKEFFNAPGIDLAAGAKLIPLTDKNERLVNSAIHPKLPIAAYITEKSGKFRLSLYDFKKNKKTDISDGSVFGNYSHFSEVSYPIAYHPNGSTLLAVMPFEDDIAIYNFSGGKLTFLPLKNQMDHINNICFSSDGKNIIISGNKDGFTDLYLFAKNTFTQLTFDGFDDTDPVFLSDTSVIFASNRDSMLLTRSKLNLNFLDNCNDLYEYSIKRKTIRRLTTTPYFSEKPLRIYSGKLIYLSDPSGTSNLLFKGIGKDTAQKTVTAFKQSITDLNKTGNGIFISSFQNGNKVVWSGDTLDTRKSYPASDNPYVKRRKVIWEEKEEKRKRKEERKNVNIPEPEEKFDTIIKTQRRNSRYYVFDDDTDTAGKRAPKKVTIIRRRTLPRSPEPEETFSDVNNLKINTTYPLKNTLYYKTFNGMADFDPAFGLNFHGKIIFEDAHARKRLITGTRLYLNFRNANFYARYQWLAGKILCEAGAEYSLRFFDSPQNFRYQNYRIYGVAALPLNQLHRISVQPFLNHTARTDLRLNDLENKDGDASSYGLDLNYHLDVSKSKGGTSVGGFRGFLKVRTAGTFGSENRSFTEISGDVRKYQSIFRNKWILALRFSAGAFLGENKKSYYFGGYPGAAFIETESKNNLNIAGNPEHFQYSHWITNVRGFNLNARTGTQFGLLNAELRMPLGLLFNKKIQPVKNPYSAIWTIFYDLGTTWSTGNPFSQRNPIDANTLIAPPFTITVQSLKSPFLMGVGTGLRVLIAGHYVRGDVAWSIEDGSLGNTKFVLSLCREF